MPQYSPPPPTLDHLNPIQRYMQKGQLDFADWLRLGVLVAAYFIARPYIHKAAKWWFGDEKMKEGEKAQLEYMQRRAEVDANEIRSGKKKGDTALDEIKDGQDVTTSGRRVAGDSTVVNRKTKPQPGKKPLEEQLLDWDDEPLEQPKEIQQGDVSEWLNKWEDKVEI